MELAQLRYFLKIVEHRNFTRAAKACNVSQPALSQQIAKLEKELGSPLFERQGRKVRLTHTGRILRSNADIIMRQVQDAHRQINDDGKSGVVSFSTISTVGPFLVTKLFRNLCKQFPDAVLQLNEESPEAVLQKTVQGDLDFAITVIDKSTKNHLICEPLLKEDILVVCSTNHRLAKKKAIELQDLNDEPLIMMGKRFAISQQVENMFVEHALGYKPVARVEQFSTLQHLVAIGAGVAFVPSMAVNPKFKENLSYIPIAGFQLERLIGLVWNEKRFQSQLATNMIKAILEFADPSLAGEKSAPNKLARKVKQKN